MMIRQRAGQHGFLRAVGALVCALLTLTACANDSPESVDGDDADTPQELVLVSAPSEAGEDVQETNRVIVEILESQLGIPLRFQGATDATGTVESLIADRADAGRFGAFSYVLARGHGAQIEPVGILVEEEGGAPSYRAAALVRADSDIESLADLSGETVCFVEPASTSGHLYPSAGLIAEGVDPEEDIDAVFAGAHDASALAVKNEDCVAGFSAWEFFEQALIDSGDLEEGELRVLWESDEIPLEPFVISTSLPEDLQEEIADVVVNNVNRDWAVENGFCEDHESCVIGLTGFWGFVPVDDSLFDGVREVCDLTQAAICEEGG